MESENQTLSHLEHTYQCSINLERDARGVPRWGIKSYHDPGQELKAIWRIREADAEMARIFLSPSTDTLVKDLEASLADKRREAVVAGEPT